MEFVTELKKIGLTDKEAGVYLACLQLGASPVQAIARKAGVVRATTYVVLEALAKKGLVTEYSEGKRTLFAAEPPRQLLRVLEKQAESVRERERLLESILPELQVLLKSGGERPSVRYYDGKEGLRAIRQEIIMYSKPGSLIVNLTPADHLSAQFPEDHHVYYQQRVAKKVRSRTIFTTHSAEFKNRLLSADFARFSERIYVPPHRFPAHSGITAFEDRLAIGSYGGHTGGVIIENESMAKMMQGFFEMAWLGAKQIGEMQTPEALKISRAAR